MAETIRYQTNGALNPGSPSYIRRAADDDIWDNLEAGEFCYVLAPRQMGKSSLLWQTVERLRASGVCVATANIQGMGNTITEAEFYEGVIDQLVTTAAKNAGFQMPFDWSTWWDQQSGPFSLRFVTFLREAFLKSTSDEQRWVIAIDEIDATISLSFTDSFFTAIRTCHDFRPGEPMFRRLSFILLGVATPDALIKDRTRTPFNVGRQVDLRPFSDSEALPLAKGLPLSPELNASVLQRVMYWTQGQPHLTQDACDALAKLWRKEPRPSSEESVQDAVDGLIHERYLNAATRGENPHLDYIEQRRVANFAKKTALLRTYMGTLREPGVSDGRQSGVAAELKISGLARRDTQGFLKVANRIYATVFNEKWARSNIPNNWPVIRAVAVGVVALLIAVGSEYGYRRPEALATQLVEASGDLELARRNYVALQSYPFYGEHAATLWGEFQERRFRQAVDLDEEAIKAGSRERQAEAFTLATSACEELDACPGENWKQQAETLWQDFQKQRLLAAIKLDEASWVAVDNLPSSAADEFGNVPVQDSSEAERLRLQEAQRNAYELAQQAHAAFEQSEAMAQTRARRRRRRPA